ncbi:MraY-like glycosyltransferase [Symmachiella dynata]|uniref:hypothetical protein n=1 Tax=Symmachiella dynata TaxID=2527995 RepID=UPI00118A6B16|nr:hypothetical protein [Symmachiella dynata]QDT49793.1 MraY-like glycosyltransferase [Symmachiella dynata]
MRFPPFLTSLTAATVFCCLLLGSASTRVVGAEEPSPATIDHLAVGFDGYYKVGEWSPLFVTVTAATDCSARLVVSVPDIDADMSVLTSETVELAAGKPFRFESRFKTGRANGELRIRVETDAGPIASKLLRVSDESPQFREGLLPAQQLWVAIGDPAGLETPSVEGALESEITVEVGKPVIAHISVENLPSIWQSYTAIDALIVAAAATTPEEKPFPAEITEPQSAAVALWVRCGGYLIFSLGRDVEAYDKSPLAKWMPVKVIGQAETRQLGDVESIAGQRDPLPRFRGVKTAVISEDEADFDGVVVKRGRTGPTLLRMPYGLGRIVFFTIDVNLPPIKGWKAATALLENLVNGETRSDLQSQQTASGQLSKRGITDLSSQFLATLQDWDNVPRISVWTVLGLIALYGLLIGPLDYWIVQKVFKKPELTWVTFPLFVALAGGLAIWMSTASHSKTVQVKQTSFIDLDTSTEQLLVRSWFGVYSPENKLYTIEAQPEPFAGDKTAPREIELSWLALAEDAVGGLNRQGGIHLTDRTYDYGTDEVTMKNVPIGHWSAKSFLAQWDTTRSGLVDNQLESSGMGRMRGRISHSFPVPLRDCVLAYGGQAYLIDQLAPYQQWRPNAPQSRELRSFLTGLVAKQKTMDDNKASFDEFFEERTTYNPDDRDLENVSRMLTFYETAGGAAYTGLAHDVSPELDYSKHLRLGRAVLLARIDLSPTTLHVDGVTPENTQQETFVRILLPVRKTDVSGGRRTLPTTDVAPPPRPKR